MKGLRFKPEAALRFGVAEKRERNAGIDFAVVRFNQGVERAAHRTGVPRDVGQALLVVVELFERRHRKEDVVLGKAEERERVVHEHVGVEHKEPRLAVGHVRAALSSLKRPLNAGRRRAAARKSGRILLRARGLSLRLRFCFRGLGGERLRGGFLRRPGFLLRFDGGLRLGALRGFGLAGRLRLRSARRGFLLRFLCGLLFGSRLRRCRCFGRSRCGSRLGGNALAGPPRRLFGLFGLRLHGGFLLVGEKCDNILHFWKRPFGLRLGGSAIVLKNVCGS